MNAVLAEAPEFLSDQGIVRANPTPALGEYSLSGRTAAFKVTAPWAVTQARWFRPVLGQLAVLLALPPNWDSYGGRAAGQAPAEQAINFLVRTLPTDAAPPWIVPLSDGGVQLEWHRGDLDIEVVLSPDEGTHVYVADLAAETEWEGVLDDEALTMFHGVVSRLAT